MHRGKWVAGLIFCGIVCSAAVAVIFQIRAGKIAPVKKFCDYDAMMRFDPSREGGHLLPGLNMLVQSEKRGQGVRVITNSKGFRNDREFDYAVPEGTLRILFLGDSFVDGMRTGQDNTIGCVLEQLLNADLKKTHSPFQQVEVMIAGNNNPANAWYYYQEHGSRYHPQLVILGITLGNDITWNSYKTGMIPAGSGDGTRTLKIAPDAIQDGVAGMPLPFRKILLPKDAYSPGNSFWEKIQDKELSVRNELARKSYWFGYGIPPELGPWPSARRRVYAMDFFNSLGLYYQPPLPEIERILGDFEEILSGIQDSIKAQGGKLLVVLFPVRIQVSEKDWNLLSRFYSLDKAKFDLSYPNRRLTAFCKAHEIDSLDLRVPFKRRVERTREKLYRANGDSHLNERGQALAAREIDSHVRNWIDGEDVK